MRKRKILLIIKKKVNIYSLIFRLIITAEMASPPLRSQKTKLTKILEPANLKPRQTLKLTNKDACNTNFMALRIILFFFTKADSRSSMISPQSTILSRNF